MKYNSWRSALAVPAVVSIAFGGALLAAGPALATPADPAVSTSATTAAADPTTAAADPTTAAADPTTTAAAPTTTAPAPTTAPATDPATTPAADPTTTAPADPTTTPAATPTTSAPTATPTATSTATATPTATATAPSATAFAVTTPVDGVPVPTTTPIFSGTGLAGSTVEIDYIGGDQNVHTAGTATVDGTGAWTITTAFSDLGPGVTKAVLTVADLDASGEPVQGATPVVRLVTFLTPPVQAQGQSIVLTPNYPTVDGAAVSGIGLAATGFTADEPLAITVTGPGGKPSAWQGSVVTPVADATGAFSELLALPADAVGGTYVVTVTGATSHLVLTKSAFVLGDPAITSPTTGEKIVGTSVTFTGTGTPGSSIGLVIAPTSEIKAAEAAEASASTASDTTKKAPAAAAPSASADPSAGNSQNIPVGANGTWSVTVALGDPGDYTAVAIAGVVDANGDPISDNTGLPVLSGPSADVEFVLAAVPVVTTTASTGGTLAFTGSNAEPYVVAGGIAVLLGLGLMVATRRRRGEVTE